MCRTHQLTSCVRRRAEFSSLCRSVQFGHVSTVKMLLDEMGADINSCEGTPLNLAMSSKMDDVACVLIARGCKLDWSCG